LIYLNGATDPYSNNNGFAMLQENINNVNAVIGFANYDVGHVFSTGGGGVAFLGVICGTSKAGGVTGLPSPFGDPFYIDYVAHEMGHQFGGNHTFNSEQGGCGGGNRSPSAAYEPGSASTIMGYAGLCGGDNLQNNSDAYFHIHSIIEIRNHVENGTGNNCPVVTSTGNGDPTVTVPTGGFYIPKSTPFSLTGSATDPNSDSVFYCWEQYNLGPAGSWNNPSGNAPIFRSFNPTSNGTRLFPKLSSLLNNTVNVGEILPSYDRILTFRLTARDNKPGGGGLANDVLFFSVDGTSGPFLVTFPNTNVTIGGDQTITWDVAGTTASPVSCADVKISLSTDGGNTWPTVLAASTPNDGSQLVTLPLIDNTQARIKIEAVGNVFFDISNVNFTLTSTIGIQNLSGTPVQFALEQNYPNPFNPTTMINYGIPKKSSVTMEIYDVTGRLVSAPIQNLVQTEGNYRLEFDGTNLPSGVYYYRITAGEFKDVKKMILIK
jgi:Metallo-peptidase family M12B Reprolysin-like/Secretion system C-terminal sorting domain